MKLGKQKDRIVSLLKKYHHLRDDHNKLLANIWNLDLKKNGIDPNSISAYDFLRLVSEGKLTNPESIRRMRQKIQEEFPEYRGKNYKSRQKEAANVKKELFDTPEFYKGGTP